MDTHCSGESSFRRSGLSSTINHIRMMFLYKIYKEKWLVDDDPANIKLGDLYSYEYNIYSINFRQISPWRNARSNPLTSKDKRIIYRLVLMLKD